MEDAFFERNGETPLYRQLAEWARALIFEGTFEPGCKIPSIRKLSEHLSVSKTTVVDGLRLLEDWGMVEARPRSGYFVQPPHRRRLSAGVSLPADIEQTAPLAETTASGSDPHLRMMVAGASSEVFRLGVAVPPSQYFPVERLSKILARVVRQRPAEAFSCSDLQGHSGLRVQIARRAVAAGVSISPEEIIVTNGAREALILSLRSAVAPGGVVAVESPTYHMFVELLEMCGIEAIEVATEPGKGMRVDALREVLDAGDVSAIFLVSNVSNPGGAVMPEARKQRIVELASSRGVPIIEDDVNAELVFAQRRPKSLKAFDTTGDVLWCGSFSKSLAPGLRVGWVAPGKRRDHVAKLKSSASYATGTPQQMAVAAFLRTGGYDHHLKKLRRVYRGSVTKMRRLVEAHFPASSRANHPRGGHMLWVELPSQVDSLLLAEQAQAEDISIGPGPVFSASRRFRNFIRLNCAVVWTDAVEDAVARLGQLAHAQLR